MPSKRMVSMVLRLLNSDLAGREEREGDAKDAKGNQ
jgi:hypothetical protein